MSLAGVTLQEGSPPSGDGGSRPIRWQGRWARFRRLRWRWPPKRILHNVRLGPDEQIHIAIPVHSWPCAKIRNSNWLAVPTFNVSYRFMFFHHVAALPWGHMDEMIIMRGPFGKPGQPGVFCAT